jgi:hypothetical protein
MARKRTKLVRVYSDMDSVIKMKFPNIRSADLYQFMYQSSALRVEAWLRHDKKKKKKTR